MNSLISLPNPQGSNKLKEQLLKSAHIHAAMFLSKTPDNIPGFTIASSLLPSEEVDGDFFDFSTPLPHIFDFAIGDVMGKGLPATLIGLAVKNHINRFTDNCQYPFTYSDGVWKEDIPAPKDMMDYIHEMVVAQLMALESFVSLIYGRFDLKKREFEFVDSGFTKPLYFRKENSSVTPLSGTNFPLGIVSNNEYFPVKISYKEGDFFVLYSDGVTQALSVEGEPDGERHLIELVKENANTAPEELIQIIKNSVTNFTKNSVFKNDLVLVVIRVDQFITFHERENKPVKFNSTLAQLSSVKEVIQDYSSQAPGDSSLLKSQLELIADEVFTNIVKHGYSGKPGGPIFLHVNYEKDGLSIEFADQGLSFSPSAIPHPNFYGDENSGYGWYLIKHLSDRIAYYPKKAAGGWNRLNIFKRYLNHRAQMELTHQIKAKVLIITLESEHLDARDIPEFKDKIIDILAAKDMDNVVFDLHKLQFIDSSGLGSFLSILRFQNTKGGQLKLADMKKPVQAIFELVSMQKIFQCYQTVDEAISSFVPAQENQV